MPPQPLLTRRVKVCFEVEVQIQPLPASLRSRKPELAVLQQVMLDNPTWLNQAIAYQALLRIADAMTIDMDFWIPNYPEANLLNSAYEQSPESLRRLLFENLVHKSLKRYTDALYQNGFSARITDHPHANDSVTGERLCWNMGSDTFFHLQDRRHRYQTAFVEGEYILCLNLVRFKFEDMPISEANRSSFPPDRILAFVASRLPAEEQEELLGRIRETFGDIPAEIYAAPKPNHSKPRKENP